MLPVNTIKSTKYLLEHFNLQDSSNDIYLAAINKNSEYKDSALNYIAGFV
jgi:hypothetical protein